MTKRLLYYLFALLVFSACMPDMDMADVSTPLDPSLKGKPVIVSFSVPGIRITPPTKSLNGTVGDLSSAPYLDPDMLYVIVCGSTQNIKYIRKAELKNSDPVEVRIDEIPDFPSNIIEGYRKENPDNVVTVPVYTFTVQLEVEDQIRTIHFLGNIDDSQLASGEYAYQVLPSLISQKGKQAYWQKVKSSILPKKKENSETEFEIDEATGSYIASDETNANLQYIPLIRNYAKIQVSDSTDDFMLYSYAVCNVPSHGSVVPFRSNLPFDPSHRDTGFTFRPTTINFPGDYRFSGYERCLSGSLDSLEYPGNLPARAILDERLPSPYAFLHPEANDSVILYTEHSDQGFYLYERGVPTAGMDKPTVVIICGRFKEGPDDNTIDPEHDELYYYRLDLMETKKVGNESVSQYYPLYRNFRYNIVIRMITSQGLETPEAALNASKVEDISADVSMQHLSDISNGITRLVVEPFMSHTYTGPRYQNPEGPRQYYELYARFFNNLESDVPNRHPYAVTVELEPTEDGVDIVTLYDDEESTVNGFYFPKARDTLGMEGMRLIRFDVITPSGTGVKKQKIKITGRNYDEEHPEIYDESLRLYREVEIAVQPPQNMTVSCLSQQLGLTIGSRQTVRVSIPDGLPESMFPLDFTIEAEDLTLTPENRVSNNNLPVVSGLSISDNEGYAGNRTIQFIKTLTLEEYNRLPISSTPEGNMRYFDCVFKTTVSKSATTVWVYNEYFNKGSDSFENTAHFYIKALAKCFVKVKQSNLKYRIGEDGDWKSYSSNTAIPLEAEEKVYFKSTTTKLYWTQSGDHGLFRCYSSENDHNNADAKDGEFLLGGDISSLIVGDDYVELGRTISGDFNFKNLFKNHVNLRSASELKLPMETCKSECYKSMFEGCANLEYAPELPAKKIAHQCYRRMFMGCTALREAPDLPATSLNDNCYQMMFNGCENISAIKMNSSEYKASNFFSTNSYDDGTDRFWLGGVAASGTIWLNPAIKNSSNWRRVAPQGWTIKTYPDGEEPWP